MEHIVNKISGVLIVFGFMLIACFSDVSASDINYKFSTVSQVTFTDIGVVPQITYCNLSNCSADIDTFVLVNDNDNTSFFIHLADSPITYTLDNYCTVNGNSDSGFHGLSQKLNRSYSSLFYQISTSAFHTGYNPSTFSVVGCPIYHASGNQTQMCETFLDKILDGSLIKDPNYDPNDSTSLEDGVLDKSIGYLMNVKKTRLTVTNNSDIVTNVINRITWTDTTSTGLSISDFDGSRVQVKVRIKGSYGSKKTPFIHDGEMKTLFPCNANELKWQVSSHQLKNAFPEFWQEYDDVGILTSKTQEYIYYARLCVPSDGGFKCGGWVEIKNNGKPLSTTQTGGTDITPDGIVPDPDSPYKDGTDVPVDAGGGDSPEDAEDNIVPTPDSGDVIDNIQGFIDGIGEVPLIIAEVFSFLPSWVLGFIGTGFAIFIALLVIKAIRG